MPGPTSMSSVEVAASPECAALASMTSRHHLYVCIDVTCSLRALLPHQPLLNQWKDKQAGQMITWPSSETSPKLVTFVRDPAAVWRLSFRARGGRPPQVGEQHSNRRRCELTAQARPWGF
jgi:hypothetical protein